MDKNQPVPPVRQFKRPNTFLVPNYIFDELLSKMSGSETKVLFYLYRWTVHGPPLSGQQIADGSRLSKRTVQKSLQVLSEMGEIQADFEADQYCIPMEDNTAS